MKKFLKFLCIFAFLFCSTQAFGQSADNDWDPYGLDPIEIGDYGFTEMVDGGTLQEVVCEAEYPWNAVEIDPFDLDPLDPHDEDPLEGLDPGDYNSNGDNYGNGDYDPDSDPDIDGEGDGTNVPEPTPREELQNFAEGYEGTRQIGGMCAVEAILFIMNYFGENITLNQLTRDMMVELLDPMIPTNGLTPEQLAEYVINHFEYEIVTTEQGLIEALEAGHPVLAIFIDGDIDGDGILDGHAVVVYGYEIDEEGEIEFFYFDPQDGSIGNSAGFDEFAGTVEILGVL